LAKIIKEHLLLSAIFLVGYLIIFIGSWALFGFGILLFIPIYLGMLYSVISVCKGKVIVFRDLFRYFNKIGRSIALSHYAVLSNIYLLLLAVLFRALYNFLRYALLTYILVNPYADMGVVMVSALVYISFQTALSFTTIIKLDRGVSTSEAMKESINIFLKRPIYYIVIRYIFFFRNFLIFGILVMRLLYNLGITESPKQMSGDPVMYSIILWFILLVITGPFYEKIMFKMYIKSKEH